MTTSARAAKRWRRRPTSPSPLVAAARREQLAAWALVAPLLSIFGLFYLWPAANTVASSLFQWGLLRPWSLFSPSDWDFVGLGNYRATLTSARVWNSLVNTIVWLIGFPVAVTAGSLLIAVFVWQAPAGQRAFRTAFILPMTISLTAAGVIWTFMYDPDFGVLDSVLRTLHLDFEIDWGPLELRTSRWLSDPGSLDLGFTTIRLINLSLITAGFWAFAGFGVITFTAGLSSVNEELIDAARVDGASTRQMIWHVLIPALRAPLVVVATVSTIFALRTFDLVWVITQGGPATDSEVLAVTVWKQGFVFLDSPQAGTATALAVIMSVVLIAGAYPYLKNVVGQGARS